MIHFLVCKKRVLMVPYRASGCESLALGEWLRHVQLPGTEPAAAAHSRAGHRSVPAALPRPVHQQPHTFCDYQCTMQKSSRIISKSDAKMATLTPNNSV